MGHDVKVEINRKSPGLGEIEGGAQKVDHSCWYRKRHRGGSGWLDSSSKDDYTIDRRKELWRHG